MKPAPDPKVTKAVIRFPEPAATSCRKPNATHSRLPRVPKSWYDDRLLPPSCPWKTPFHSPSPAPSNQSSLLGVVEGAGQPSEATTSFYPGTYFAKCLGWNFKGMNWVDDGGGCKDIPIIAGFQPNLQCQVICLKNVTRATEVPRMGDCQLEGVWMRLMGLAGVTGPQSSFGRRQLKIGVWQRGQGSQELMCSSWNCTLCCKSLCSDYKCLLLTPVTETVCNKRFYFLK